MGNGATTGQGPSTTAVKTKKLSLDFSLRLADCTTSITFGLIPTCNREKKPVKLHGENPAGTNVWPTRYLSFNRCTRALWSHFPSPPLNKNENYLATRFIHNYLLATVLCSLPNDNAIPNLPSSPT